MNDGVKIPEYDISLFKWDQKENTLSVEGATLANQNDRYRWAVNIGNNLVAFRIVGRTRTIQFESSNGILRGGNKVEVYSNEEVLPNIKVLVYRW